jgi:hypothetical protein
MTTLKTSGLSSMNLWKPYLLRRLRLRLVVRILVRQCYRGPSLLLGEEFPVVLNKLRLVAECLA